MTIANHRTVPLRLLCPIASRAQDHYDYGLRSFVIPIARAAGFLKRVDPEALEEVIL